MYGAASVSLHSSEKHSNEATVKTKSLESGDVVVHNLGHWARSS